MKLAERDTLGKGPKPTDKPLQAVRRALALSDEVKRMRGSPPDTADADAVRLYEYAAINSAEIGDPDGANRYLAMRTELLARSPELVKKVSALVAIDPKCVDRPRSADGALDRGDEPQQRGISRQYRHGHHT